MCERQSIRRCGCCNFQSSHADLTQLMHEFDGFSVSPHVQVMFPIASNCKEEHICLFSVLESLWFLEAGWCIFQIAFIKDANVCRFDLRRCFRSQFCTTLCTWLTVKSSTCTWSCVSSSCSWQRTMVIWNVTVSIEWQMDIVRVCTYVQSKNNCFNKTCRVWWLYIASEVVLVRTSLFIWF
jgi:hypothetical protein